MKIDIEVLEVLGVPAETILAAVKAQRAMDEQASAVRRQKDAARQKRWRASRRMSHVSRVAGVTSRRSASRPSAARRAWHPCARSTHVDVDMVFPSKAAGQQNKQLDGVAADEFLC
jgi:hypothetical protein